MLSIEAVERFSTFTIVQTKVEQFLIPVSTVNHTESVYVRKRDHQYVEHRR